MSSGKKSLLGSMLALRCPQCREAHLYVNPNTYSLRQLGKNHQVCPVCNVNLQPEPGFYFGAAYVSWGLTVILWMSVLAGLYLLDFARLISFSFLTHPGTFLLSGFGVTILLFPYLFRLSRSIWAHVFIRPTGKS